MVGVPGVFTLKRLIAGFAAVQMVTLVGVDGIVESRRDRALQKASSPCGQEISSHASKNGTFSSPNYPEPYPRNALCQYKFSGEENERIQIIFTDFDLHLPHAPPSRCESVDAVMVFITPNGSRRDSLDPFCGNKLPPQLMSSSPSMSVEFKSHHSSPEVKGFRAIYRFVTDFGITSTKQNQGSACEFVFKSEDRRNGSFSSPNYPGFYPRDTECRYTFLGRPRERVYVNFPYFEVDGIAPCLSATDSDYVEFSNHKSASNFKTPRYCGEQKPKEEVESEAEYFRITLKSNNDRFDGRGFEAFYHFREQVDPLTVKRLSATSANGSSSKPHFLNSIASGASFGVNAVTLTFCTFLIHIWYSSKL